MDKEVPTWLNKDFLTLALQGGEEGKPRVDITDYSIKPAVAPGNNTTSDMFRVNIDYRVEGNPDNLSISLIVKAPIETGIVKEFADKGDYLSIEPKMYKTVLPYYLEKFNFEFGPKYYYTAKKNSLVLKDLKPDGYVVCNKFKQLDIKHCRKVVSCMAKFHAASVAYYHEDPDTMKTFHEERCTNESSVSGAMKSMLKSSFELFNETLDKNGLSMKDYVSSRVDHLWNSLVTLLAPSTNTLNVLNHGDLWTNNMLFKYNDSGDISDVKLIDYQIMRYSSPVSDLLYFIWTSGDEDVRDNHQQELFNLYRQTLNSTLEDLNCQERLTEEELSANLKSCSDWVLYLIGFILPFTLVGTDKALDFGNMSDMGDITDRKDANYCALHSNKRYVELLPGYLRQLERFLSSV